MLLAGAGFQTELLGVGFDRLLIESMIVRVA